MMEIKDLSLNLLDVGRHEQRFAYDDEEQATLTASIRSEGILVPLIVRPQGERYLIVDGHRRRQAATAANLPTVPCQIQSTDPARDSRTAFIANFLRKDPTPVELAVAIARAIETGADAEAEIAAALHRSVEWVRRQVAFLEWPEDVLQAVHRGQLSVAAASNLACVTDDRYRQFLLENAVQNGATARTTAAWLQAWRAALPLEQALAEGPAPGPALPPALMPQAPCLCCGQIHRTDELSHVPLCGPCIQRVRHLGTA
jgi:ParB family chromosome partitioning protein